MQPAGTLAAAQDGELVPFQGMPSAHDAYGRREVFEMGSVSGVPSIGSARIGWSGS
jgi:hypothetical protein